jgi:hypothetical protein
MLMGLCFFVSDYHHHNNNIDPMFKDGAEQVPQLKIASQIRRAVFILSYQCFLDIYDLSGFQ